MQDQREPTPATELVEHRFARRMREARESAGLSQTKLAAELERRFDVRLDGTAITRIEKRAASAEGGRAIRLGEAIAIAAVLNLSLDGLIQPAEKQRLAEAESRMRDAELAFTAAQERYKRAAEEVRLIYRRLEVQERIRRIQAELPRLADQALRFSSEASTISARIASPIPVLPDAIDHKEHMERLMEQREAVDEMLRHTQSQISHLRHELSVLENELES